MPATTDASTLRNALFAQLPAGTRKALDALIEAAHPAAAYAVGGAVRDAIIGRGVVDLDLAIEGDAIDIAQRALPSTRMTAHSRFRTASFIAGGRRLDAVTARSETYPKPGALPRVTPATIDDDLRRRDFTVNALALRLSGTPVLLDPCGGLDDVDARLIRVLHDGSFRDDATRIFRACRYAARLGFTIEPHTRALAAAGLGCIDPLSGGRVRRELELILDEASAPEALRGLGEIGALAALHPSLSWRDSSGAGLAIGLREGVRVASGFAMLAADSSAQDAEAIVERLRLRRDQAAAVRGIAGMRETAPLLSRGNAKPSGVVMLLDRYPPASVIAFAATTDNAIAASLALRYLGDWLSVTPALRGDDVIAMGIPEGPNVQKALQLVRAALLDGTASDLADERMLVLRFARSIREAGVMTGDIELRDNGH